MGFFRRGRDDDGVATVQAVVVDYGMGRDSGITLPEGNASRRTTAVVQIVGDDRRHEVSGRLKGHSWWLMAEGDTIPVRVDAEGRAVGFDRQAVDALYGARTDEMTAARRHFSSLRTMVRDEMGLDPRQIRDAAAIAREALAAPKVAWDAATDPQPTPPPTAEPAPPIEGVSFTTFVEVQAALVRDRVPADRHEEVAVALGAPPGTWADASAAWHRTVRSDPAVAQAFGAAYQAAVQRPPG